MRFGSIPDAGKIGKTRGSFRKSKPSVLAMLRISQAAEIIRSSINDVLAKQYHLSQGKLRVAIVLHRARKVLHRRWLRRPA